MLKNYFKIAIAVLKRRKFFTFISLFGISFTLTILMVLTAFVDKVIGDSYPDKKGDRTLYINTLQQSGKNSNSSGRLSFYFLDHYARALKTPVRMTIFSGFSGTNTYVNDKKIAIDFKYTDADYWEVLDYDFLEGKPYTKQMVSNGEHVAVISDDIKKAYFGDVSTVVGKYIEADNVQYRICGVVRNIPITTYMLYSELYLPYTLSKTDYTNKNHGGGYMAILLAPSKEDVHKMKQEYEQMIPKIPIQSKEFNKLYSPANPYVSAYLNTGDESSSGTAYALIAMGILVFFVMILPAMNLVNINLTRIMERSSEIGVRKAFGASSRTLVYQFIIENLILTLSGTLIGILLSFVVIQIVNNAKPIVNLELSLNPTVLFYGFLSCLVFGLLSGVYPAWRMSRLNVVTALKA